VIIGVGVDLVDVGRMERTLRSRWKNRFLQRVFSKEEIAVCEAKACPAQGYAARFAAKEALAKALGTGFSRGVSPAGVIVEGGERERPAIRLKGRALDVAQAMKLTAIHLSMSHTDGPACAFVVVEKGD
jgi:holo-[acyl-carrier protein] synthase